VVVLDGSRDGSAERLRGFEAPFALRVAEQPPSGLATARNRGAAEAAHPVVLFLDDDIVADPGLVAAHAAGHARGAPDRVAIGYTPPVIRGTDAWPAILRAWWEDHFARKARPDHRWSFLDCNDGNTSLPVTLLRACGGFDAAFSGRRQDLEIGIRLFEAGARLDFVPGAVGHHHLDTTFATAARNASREGTDDVRLARRHPDALGALPIDAALSERAVRHARDRLAPPSTIDALARAADAAGRRSLAARLYAGCLWREYVRGVADEVARDGLPDLRPPLRVPVDVLAPAPVQPLPTVLPVVFELDVAGASVTVPARQPGDQWDTGGLLARAVPVVAPLLAAAEAVA
jgi:glycosyltransferase involved in cell wall biosynthesis